MGYPMTFRRVLSRNGLVGGGYEAIPDPKPFPEAGKFNEGVDYVAVLRDQIVHLEGELTKARCDRANLLGDLRRLEQDALDERGICGDIALRLKLQPDMVAAVLREFMET